MASSTFLENFCAGENSSWNTSLPSYPPCGCDISSLVRQLSWNLAIQPSLPRLVAAGPLGGLIGEILIFVLYVRTYRRLAIKQEHWSPLVLSQLIMEILCIAMAVLMILERLFVIGDMQIWCMFTSSMGHVWTMVPSGIFLAFLSTNLASQFLILLTILDQLQGLLMPIAYHTGVHRWRRCCLVNAVSYMGGIAVVAVAYAINPVDYSYRFRWQDKTGWFRSFCSEVQNEDPNTKTVCAYEEQSLNNGCWSSTCPRVQINGKIYEPAFNAGLMTGILVGITSAVLAFAYHRHRQSRISSLSAQQKEMEAHEDTVRLAVLMEGAFLVILTILLLPPITQPIVKMLGGHDGSQSRKDSIMFAVYGLAFILYYMFGSSFLIAYMTSKSLRKELFLDPIITTLFRPTYMKTLAFGFVVVFACVSTVVVAFLSV